MDNNPVTNGAEPWAEILCGDCLELFPSIVDQSVDLVLCDLPYGTTACSWDVIIPFDKLWAQYKRVIKPGGVIALFGAEPFSSQLRMSNLEWFRYDWIWDKKIPSGMSYARFQPMRQHEIVSVFYDKGANYYPQKTKRDKPIRSGGMSKGETTNNQNLKPLKKSYEFKNPTSLISFDKIRRGSLHPTQKPVDLLEYLIRTYTEPNQLVLDNTMGSGSTGVAALKTQRNFIGIEKDESYFNIAIERIKAAKAEFLTNTVDEDEDESA